MPRGREKFELNLDGTLEHLRLEYSMSRHATVFAHKYFELSLT